MRTSAKKSQGQDSAVLGMGFYLVTSGHRQPCPYGSRAGQAGAQSYV